MVQKVVAIIGRPNVGKSTLFNRLVEKRQAIVQDSPGVTRDRQYGEGEIGGRRVWVIDTGGLDDEVETSHRALTRSMREQAELAMEEADLILCVFDGQVGLMPQDIEVARQVSKTAKPVLWVVNKIDGPRHEMSVVDFYELGVDTLYGISAQHTGGLLDLFEAMAEALEGDEWEDEARKEEDEDRIHVSFVGRPNVGKSTLLNRLIGEERMIVSDVSGTTRDAIDTPYQRKLEDGGVQTYLLIDTAGVRRRKWIKTSVEKISIVRTFKAIDRSDVCFLLLDAIEGVTDQDKRLAGMIEDKGKACIIVVNKWDMIEDKTDRSFGEYVKTIHEDLPFMKWAPIVSISALSGQRTHRLMDMVDAAFQSYDRRISTGELNRVFERIIHHHQPPVVHNKRVRLYYATQVKTRPPRFVLWCNDADGVRFSYKRFLQNQFREEWGFEGSPIKLHVRAKDESQNPYVNQS